MGCRELLFTYQSVRYVSVEAKLPAIIFRVLQLVTIAYVVLFSVLWKQSYQEYDQVVAETFLKMKGAAMINNSVYDVNDLVVPAQMENALFITTNHITNTETRNSKCASTISCDATTPCQADAYVRLSSDGVLTGRCIDTNSSTMNGTNSSTANGTNSSIVTNSSAANVTPATNSTTVKGTCEVRGWCAGVDVRTMTGSLPYDPDPDLTGNVVANVENWSLFVRVNSEFPLFGVKLNSAEKELRPDRNLWQIKKILENAGTSYQEISATGAIILMRADFDCNFNGGDDCQPEWTYERLDKTRPDANFSTGFNFYTVQYEGPNQRTVTKRYGIKIEVSVSGRGGKFSIVNCLIAVGAGISLLSIASLVTDFVLQHIEWKGRNAYNRTQVREMDEADFATEIDPKDAEDPLMTSLRTIAGGNKSKSKSENDRQYHDLGAGGANHLKG